MTAITDRGISEQRLAGRWKIPLVQLFLVLGGICLLYWRTAWSMVETWMRSETFTHGFIVLPTVLWLVWRMRREAAGVAPSPGRAALLLFPVLGFLWLAGDVAAVNSVTQFAFVSLLVLSVPALVGWHVARKFAFPLGFLFFAVPTGEFLLPQLMEWTAQFTVLGLRLSRVPVHRDGLELVIPSGNWSVAEACSGIRYLIASLMAGTLFAYLNFRSLGRRLAFVGISIIVPIIANWVRAYGIVMLGHLSGNRLATGVDHLVYGWLFFGVVIMIMFLIGARWADSEKVPPPMTAPFDTAGTDAPRRLGWGTAGLAAILMAWPVLASDGLARLNAAGPARLDKDLEPFAWRGWRAVSGKLNPLPDWRPDYRGSVDSWQQIFERNGLVVGIHIAYYRNQDYGRKMVASTNPLVDSDNKQWALASAGAVPIGLAGNEPWRANRAEVRRRTAQGADQRLLVWQWYWVAGRMTGDARQAKAYTAWSRLQGKGDDSAMIVLYTSTQQPGGGAVALEAFSQSAGAAIQELLNETRKQP